MFYFVPNAKVRFRDVWIGAFLTGLLWKGALAAFSWYMRDMSRFTRVNGSIAAVVVFLVWVYVQAVILLYGVEFTAAYARLRRGRPDERPPRRRRVSDDRAATAEGTKDSHEDHHEAHEAFSDSQFVSLSESAVRELAVDVVRRALG